MKRFCPPPEPPDFDAQVRQLGNDWLSRNLDKYGELPKGQRPPARWSQYIAQLSDGFGNLCAYSAMYEPVGTVDHYLSCENYPHLAYEWSNYRYSSSWINSSKGTQDKAILDPFCVDDNWFEILLPSLQLIVTDTVPPEELGRAEFTLRKLHLGHDERILRQRRQWYKMHQDGKLTVEGLDEVAPLIARAVRRQQTERSQ